ncbi:MAG TPA: hypothetical protein PLP17_07845 [Oligoflexia bacterium]|nr:hypothetical protein [Oligoflexia bacterium]
MFIGDAGCGVNTGVSFSEEVFPMWQPEFGAFRILRGGQDVTAVGRIEEGDQVTGPWTQFVDREIVFAYELQDVEELTIVAHGRLWKSSSMKRPFWLHGASVDERRPPIAQDQFRADYEDVGSIGSVAAYRKRKWRWGFPYSRKNCPAVLIVSMPGQQDRVLEEGDVLFCRGRSHYGIWPKARVEQCIQAVSSETDLSPLNELLDCKDQVYDAHVVEESVNLRVLRAGVEATEARVIRSGDVVHGCWLLTSSNRALCTVTPLGAGEHQKLRTPWGEVLDSEKIAEAHLLNPVASPGLRLIAGEQFRRSYVCVGKWGGMKCWRQRHGYLVLAVTSNMPSVKVFDRHDVEHEATTGCHIVYEGGGHFAVWKPGVYHARHW